MGFSQCLQSLRGLRIRRRNTDKDRTRVKRPVSTPAPLEDASYSVAGMSKTLPSLPEQSSCPASKPLDATESPSRAAPSRSPSFKALPITSILRSESSLSGHTPSLWNRAYQALHDKDEQLVVQYEEILSKELEENSTSTSGPQDTPHQDMKLDKLVNRRSTKPDERLTQLMAMIEKGLQQADEKKIKYTLCGRDFVLEAQVAQVATFIGHVKGLVDEAVKVSPEASLAWAGVCVLLPVFTNPIAAEAASRDALSYITSRLQYYIKLERHFWPKILAESELKAQFESKIVDLYQHMLELQIKVVFKFHRNWFAQKARDSIRYDNWEGMCRKVEDLEKFLLHDAEFLNLTASRETLETMRQELQQDHQTMISLLVRSCDIQSKQLAESKLSNQMIAEDRLSHLPTVGEARYDSEDVQNSPKCESGTRIRIQETITQWADEDSAEPFFWLVGPAGTGKSTIACTIADAFHGEKRLVSGYFFKRAEPNRNNARQLFPTLAAQLTETIPAFKDSLQKSLSDLGRDAVKLKSLEVQFDILLWLPLRDLCSIDTSQPPKLIVIDALDECESEHSRILSLLGRLHDIETVRLRVLFTSRATPAITRALGSVHYRCLNLEDEYQDEARSDIARFLEHKLASIRQQAGIAEPWPDHGQLDRLISLSTTPSPLFIYAVTLCRFIHDPDGRVQPKDQLNDWLQQCNSNAPQLDQVYMPILHYVLFGSYNTCQKPKPLADNQRVELFSVLGTVVLAARPVSLQEIASLLRIPPDQVNFRLRNLHAVLSIPQDTLSPVKLLHKSFSDFLLYRGDSRSDDYRVDAAQTHAMIAAKCIQRMSMEKEGLRRDICKIRKLDMFRDQIDKQVIDTHIPADLQYACLYWVHHLQHSEAALEHDIHVFLCTHLLHWLEVLALLGKVSDGAAAMKQLLAMCQRYPNAPGELSEFIKDVSKVISSFGSMIEQAPLQIYRALILFTPIASKVRQCFFDQYLRNLLIQGVKSDWDAHRQILEGHGDSVRAVAFSPDGKLVASASEDETVRLWDAATGAHRQTLEGHSDSVRAVAFSPDSKVVASASFDETVRLWDATTGAHRQTLEGHDDQVNTVAFSPDGQIIASASSDKTVRLWDAATGTHRQTLEGHSNIVRAVAFSPDSKVVASASYDKTVRLWDTASGTHSQTLEGHTESVLAVAFSPDGQMIASASEDETVRLWDATTGTHRQTLEDHNNIVKAVAFSPDGQMIASASEDETVRLWDAATGKCSQTLEGHTESVLALAFSPDGQIIASASQDETVRLWDAATGTHRQTLQIGVTNSLTFDLCSNKLLHTDLGTVDVTDPLAVESSSGHMSLSPAICELSISPDRTWIMEGREKIIRLPHEYRPIASATKGSTLFIGCASGRTICIATTRTWP